MNPDKLSLLSDQELALLAERMGVFLPDGLARPFIVEEIITALEDDDRERVFSHDGTGHVEEKKLSGASYVSMKPSELSGVPERYNETMIRALPRDPAWIYAYWDISEQKRLPMSEEEAGCGLFLRVVELHHSGEHRKDFFDIGISLDDCKWYINVPQPGSSYRVDLCQHKLEKNKVLARSNEVKMPLFYLRKSANVPQVTKSLLILSDVEGLHLNEPREANPNRILAADGE